MVAVSLEHGGVTAVFGLEISGSKHSKNRNSLTTGKSVILVASLFNALEA